MELNDWEEQRRWEVEESQRQTRYTIEGHYYDRIPYGKELDDWGADRGPCHDCDVVKGQFHLIGCDVEHCPKCGGQALSCGCPYPADYRKVR